MTELEFLDKLTELEKITLLSAMKTLREELTQDETALLQLLNDYQQNEICYIIGEWYLKWKDQLVNWDFRTHNLGRAKEDLKQMVCDWKDHRSIQQRIIGLEDELVKIKKSAKDDQKT